MTSALDAVTLPKGWEFVPFGRLVERSREAGRPDLPPLSVFLDEGVVPRAAREDNFNRLGSDMAKYLVVRPGDVVFNKLRTWQGGLGVSRYEGLVSPAYFVCRPTLRAEPRFLHHLLRSAPYLAELTRVSKFMPPSQFDILWEDLSVVPISTPPIDAQRRIADYLDTETARINALISQKRRLSDLLQSRLIALAEDAVKGRYGNTATGMPSLPVVLSSWRVLRNKVFMREVNRRSTDGNDEMLSVSHIMGVTPRSEKTVYMFETESTVGYKLVRPGDLVINTMRAWMGAAGVSDVHGIVSPAYGVYEFDIDTMLPEFFDILVRTPAYVAEMTRFSRGVTSSRLRLYPDEFLRLSSPVPPIKTQKTIIDRHASHESTATQARKRIAQQIQLLLERRQTLITAAVTGEMPAPGVAAGLQCRSGDHAAHPGRVRRASGE